MITDVERRTVRDQLNETTLADYWEQYFYYRDNVQRLHNLAEEKLINAVETARLMDKPFIDSQQVIGRVLTEFGIKGTAPFNDSAELTPVAPNCFHQGSLWP
jgi:ferritin-like protein